MAVCEKASVDNLPDVVIQSIVEYSAFLHSVAFLSYRNVEDSYNEEGDASEYTGGWTSAIAYEDKHWNESGYVDVTLFHSGGEDIVTLLSRLNILASLCQATPDSILAFMDPPAEFSGLFLEYVTSSQEPHHLVFEWSILGGRVQKIGIEAYRAEPHLVYFFSERTGQNLFDTLDTSTDRFAMHIIDLILDMIFGREYWFVCVLNNPDARLTFRSIPVDSGLSHSCSKIASLRLANPLRPLRILPAHAIPQF